MTFDSTASFLRPHSRKFLVICATGAAASAGFVLLTITALSVAGWATDSSGASQPGVDGGDAARFAGQLWLLAHGVAINVPGGQVGLVPGGLTLVIGVLLFQVGCWVARRAAIDDPRQLSRVALIFATTYAGCAVAAALAVTTDSARPGALAALRAGFGLALLAGSAGMAHATGLLVKAVRALPPWLRSALAGCRAAVAVLVAGSALLVAVSLAYHFGSARALLTALSPGPIGGVLLLLLGISLAPNAIIWAMGYALGPGFSVGAGTVVASTGVTLGALPAFPLFAALPASGPAPAASLVTLALPAVAGIVGGVVVARSWPSASPLSVAGSGLAAAGLLGVGIAVLAAALAGPIAPGRLAVVGPSAWQLGIATVTRVGLTVTLTALVMRWWPSRGNHEDQRQRIAASGQLTLYRIPKLLFTAVFGLRGVRSTHARQIVPHLGEEHRHPNSSEQREQDGHRAGHDARDRARRWSLGRWSSSSVGFSVRSQAENDRGDAEG